VGTTELLRSGIEATTHKPRATNWMARGG
jgi:hypothetical protein